MAATSSEVNVARSDTASRWSEVALSGIYEISKILTNPARVEVTLSSVITLLSSFLDMRHGLIALLNDEGEPEVVVGSAWNEETSKLHFEHLPERAVGQIVVTKFPVVVRDMAVDQLFADWKAEELNAEDCSCSFIGVPIKDRDRVIGTITIEKHNRGTDPSVTLDEDLRFLTMVANLVGQTVRLQRMVARDRERLMAERHRLEKQLQVQAAPDRDHRVAGIVGESRAIRAVLDKVRVVARSHLPILLRGESGTGKELFAQAIHDLSPRKEAPCIKLNCAALPESVLESELFGHEKGAFTGAIAQRKGRFELADHGTLFLDEIGDISPAFQAKLLRVLQEGEFERVGGTRTLKVDVRLVAATNRNLEAAVVSGAFRADLYYRISVVPIALPPLRERREDIPPLAVEFLGHFNETHGTALSLSNDALKVLCACDFPGNVRELESCVRRTAAFAQGSSIVANDFACRNDSCLSSLLWKPEKQSNRTGYIPLPVAGGGPRSKVAVATPPGASGANRSESESSASGTERAEEVPGADASGQVERAQLVDAMERAGWVQAKAARLLGLTPRQMGYALRKHSIEIKRF
ncbi:MAG: nif-specific transcriptional activator NifA [Bryobacteraceae bacterium]|jgi:Nif-specific regulatory protein